MNTNQGDNQVEGIQLDPHDPESIAAAFLFLAGQISKARQDSSIFATALGIVIGKIERTSPARPISKLFIPLADEPGFVREASPMAVAFGEGLKVGLNSPPDDGGSKILDFIKKAA